MGVTRNRQLKERRETVRYFTEISYYIVDWTGLDWTRLHCIRLGQKRFAYLAVALTIHGSCAEYATQVCVGEAYVRT